MPLKRKSLESVKARLTQEQKPRTERRVQELLRPRQRRQDPEIYDDSEEENRLIARRPQADRMIAGCNDKELVVTFLL